MSPSGSQISQMSSGMTGDLPAPADAGDHPAPADGVDGPNGALTFPLPDLPPDLPIHETPPAAKGPRKRRKTSTSPASPEGGGSPGAAGAARLKQIMDKQILAMRKSRLEAAAAKQGAAVAMAEAATARQEAAAAKQETAAAMQAIRGMEERLGRLEAQLKSSKALDSAAAKETAERVASDTVAARTQAFQSKLAAVTATATAAQQQAQRVQRELAACQEQLADRAPAAQELQEQRSELERVRSAAAALATTTAAVKERMEAWEASMQAPAAHRAGEAAPPPQAWGPGLPGPPRLPGPPPPEHAIQAALNWERREGQLQFKLDNMVPHSKTCLGGALVTAVVAALVSKGAHAACVSVARAVWARPRSPGGSPTRVLVTMATPAGAEEVRRVRQQEGLWGRRGDLSAARVADELGPVELAVHRALLAALPTLRADTPKVFVDRGHLVSRGQRLPLPAAALEAGLVALRQQQQQQPRQQQQPWPPQARPASRA